MLRPTKAYYDYLKNPFKYLAPQPARKATPLDVINNIKPLPTTAYQLALHYQRIIDNKATNQSFVYYRITDAKQDDHLGMLDGGGRDIKKNLPKGPAKVYYGLTREDATVNGKAVIQKDHDQLVSQLQTQLDSIIAKVSTKAAKGNATLKNKNMFGKGWVYTEDFFKGLIDDAKDEMQSVEKHPLDAMVDSNPALANSSSAIDAVAQFAMDSWQSGDKAAILNYYENQQADAKAQLYLGRLMIDPKCRELLYNFPRRYVQADSSTDAATMLGRFAPLLILALVTKGRSTELETSTELKTIIESIAGDKGTIERAAVQTMDEGDVESKSSQIDTTKGEVQLPESDVMVKVKRPKNVPDSWIVKHSKKKKGGLRFINPENSHDIVRSMPGVEGHPFPNSRSYYVTRQKDGVFFDKSGNIVSRRTDSAHIPFDDFNFNDIDGEKK